MKKKFLILIGLLLVAYIVGFIAFRPQTNPNATAPILTQEQINQIQKQLKNRTLKEILPFIKIVKKHGN